MGAGKLKKKDICSRSARLHHSFHAKEVSRSCRHACTTHDLPAKEAVLGSKAKLLTRREPLGQSVGRVPTPNEYHILWIATKSVEEGRDLEFGQGSRVWELGFAGGF
jgi:hypothetical protein